MSGTTENTVDSANPKRNQQASHDESTERWFSPCRKDCSSTERCRHRDLGQRSLYVPPDVYPIAPRRPPPKDRAEQRHRLVPMGHGAHDDGLDVPAAQVSTDLARDPR